MALPSWYRPRAGLVQQTEPVIAEERGLPEDSGSLSDLGRAAPVAKRIGLGAYVVAESHNLKISYDGLMSTTYAGQNSCPANCQLLGNGCYGEGGKVKLAAAELNDSCKSEAAIAKDEAQAIYQLAEEGTHKRYYRLLPLRVHTIGDCRTIASAQMVGTAAEHYMMRYLQQNPHPVPLKEGSVPAYTYTHSWNIPREAWGPMSVLKSCNNIKEIWQAQQDGQHWACCLVIPYVGSPAKVRPLDRFAALKTAPTGYRDVEFKYIPCPAQAYPKEKHEDCQHCQFCWQDQYLLRKYYPKVPVIVLYTHGQGKSTADRAMSQVFSTK